MRSSILTSRPVNLESKPSFCYLETTSYGSLNRLHRRIWRGLLTSFIRCVIQSVDRFLPPVFHIVFIKVYLTVNDRDKKFLISFGDFCSATKRLPASVVLSEGLVKCDSVPRDSGGLTDIWRGKYQGTRVAIKVFRACPVQNLEEAKKVCIRCV